MKNLNKRLDPGNIREIQKECMAQKMKFSIKDFFIFPAVIKLK